MDLTVLAVYMLHAGNQGPVPQKNYQVMPEIFHIVFYFLILIPMIQSDHNFAHAMTAELSWHEHIYDMIGSLFFALEQYIIL